MEEKTVSVLFFFSHCYCTLWQELIFWTFSQVTVNCIYTAMSDATSVLTSQEMTKRNRFFLLYFVCCWQEWQRIVVQSRPSRNKLLFIRRFLSPVTRFLFVWPWGWRPRVWAVRSPSAAPWHNTSSSSEESLTVRALCLLFSESQLHWAEGGWEEVRRFEDLKRRRKKHLLVPTASM